MKSLGNIHYAFEQVLSALNLYLLTLSQEMQRYNVK